MRFAVSAVAALSGLVLLGLTFYGQPEVYLRQARQQWDALIDSGPADQPLEPARLIPPVEPAKLTPPVEPAKLTPPVEPAKVTPPVEPAKLTPPVEPAKLTPPMELARVTPPMEPAKVTPPVEPARSNQPVGPSLATQPAQPGKVADAAAEHLAQLQQRVARLVDELAAKRAEAPQPPPTLTPPPLASPNPPPPPAAGVAALVPQPPPSPQTPVARTEPPVAPVTVTVPRADSIQAAVPIPKLDDVSRQTLSRPAESLQSTPAASERAAAQPAKTEPLRIEPRKAEAVRVAPPRPRPARQGAQMLAFSRPVPQTQAVVQPPPLDQNTDDTGSVLARLRQLTPAQQADSSPMTEPRPRPAAFTPATPPSMPRLSAARAALAAGRIEEARRLLQEAQLQLVFRSTDASSDTPPSAVRGASDVAHALDALSGNDVALGRRYIDVAVGDLSGTASEAPIQPLSRRSTGYAPAYPPR